MKAKLAIFPLLITILLFSCDKDKFQTKPQLRLKSVSPETVPFNGSVTFRIEFTDKEGDVQDSLLIKKVRLNRRVVATVLDSFWYQIPDFPKAQKGDLVVTLPYNFVVSAVNPPTIPGSNPPVKESDTLMLKFLAKDNAGNDSDTLVTSQIFVIRL